MKLITTTTHNITFYVSYFESSEDGMDTDTFGSKRETLPEAIELLAKAKTVHPDYDWIITIDVETVTK